MRPTTQPCSSAIRPGRASPTSKRNGCRRRPMRIALIASVLLVTIFTPVSEASMIAQIFNGMDVEALLAVPFFLLVGDLMTSANITMRMITLSQTLVGHFRGGLAQVVA